MAEEKTLENKLKRYLESHDIVQFGNKAMYHNGYYEKRIGSIGQKRGKPDLHICVKGYALDVEIKSSRGQPSYLQVHNCNQIIKSFGCALIIKPKDFFIFERVIEYLLIGEKSKAVELCCENLREYDKKYKP